MVNLWRGADSIISRQAALRQTPGKVESGRTEMWQDRTKIGRDVDLAGAQELVDSGRAASLEHAFRRKWAQKAKMADALKMVKEGKAGTVKEANRVRGLHCLNTKVEKLLAAGEASSVEDAVAKQAQYAFQKKLEKLGDLGVRQEAQFAGATSAIKQQKHFNLAGVIPQKRYKNGEGILTGRWLVQFRHKGERINLPGSFPSELSAAEAHDKYVRERNFDRKLHCPDFLGGIAPLGCLSDVERRTPLPPLSNAEVAEVHGSIRNKKS
jgi:hypothetical protein